MTKKQLNDKCTTDNAFAFLLVSALFIGVALVMALNI